MHLLLIHQAFVSPAEAGGTRHYELAQHLIRQGHRVSIVASNLSYLSGKQVASGKGLVTEQNIDGIRVLRAYTYASLHRSFVWRIVSFLSFMVTSVVAAFRAGRVDVVMGTSPPIFQAVSAWFVAKVCRKPFLLEIRDLWPEFAIDMGVLTNPILVAASRWLERFLYSQADCLLVNSPAYRTYLLEKGVAAEKISFIPNGVDRGMFDPEEKGEGIREEYRLADKFVITYAGALGQANDIVTLLQAAERVRSEPRIHFLLVGDGKEREKLEASASEMGLENVTFTGTQPKQRMAGFLAASDACVAILKNILMFRTTYPNKVFDYMAAGRPTILAIDGVIREVIEASQGGVYVPPGDDQALAAAVLNLSRSLEEAKEMGTRARDYVTKHFDRAGQAQQFKDLLLNLYKLRKRSRLLKRAFDLCLTVPAFILLVPLMSLIALILRLGIGRPILFRQMRPGLNGRPFAIYKFRTMRDSRDGAGRLLPDEKRLTPFGRFLRSTSLDELPELLNVLKGDMSIVGPRPLLMQYLERYSPRQARRHEVKPGITGWAQVNGRNAISWEEKFKLDVWYVEHQSFWLDFKIVIMSVWKILKREGISQPGRATMDEFMGSHAKAQGR